jgi:hypothetical protein
LERKTYRTNDVSCFLDLISDRLIACSNFLRFLCRRALASENSEKKASLEEKPSKRIQSISVRLPDQKESVTAPSVGFCHRFFVTKQQQQKKKLLGKRCQDWPALSIY